MFCKNGRFLQCQEISRRPFFGSLEPEPSRRSDLTPCLCSPGSTYKSCQPQTHSLTSAVQSINHPQHFSEAQPYACARFVPALQSKQVDRRTILLLSAACFYRGFGKNRRRVLIRKMTSCTG